MGNEKRAVVLCLFVIIIVSILITINYLISNFSIKLIGHTVNIERVSVVVEEGIEEGFINITSPENRTYNFGIGENYILDLNVTSSVNINEWKYTITDLKHKLTISENISFTPNTTINAVRWSNKLDVYARAGSGRILNDSVVFFVYVPNSAPIIEYIAPEIFVCENSYLAYYFNVTDVDEDGNLGPLESLIDPLRPFDVNPKIRWLPNGQNRTQFYIDSGILSKNDAGGVNVGWKVYEEIISVKDNYNSTCCADSKKTNITVIEINNAPKIEKIGVKTIETWTKGENSTFYKQVQVTDVEDGNQNSGNLTFNITILNSTGSVVNLFNISSNGTMNFTANESYLGVYNISVCVSDRGIKNPHPKISLCGQDGKSITSCNNFSLTITDRNRPPTIIDYYPHNLSLNISGTDNLYFNITKYDPDGTIPDSYWYVDGILEKYSSGVDNGSLVDKFTYNFGCGIYGEHTIKAEITDGLLNDSVQWNLTVEGFECPKPTAGGGGGGGREGCPEKWFCYKWDICQNSEKSLEVGILSRDDYRVIKEGCSKNKWDEKYCGFQIRDCFDVNNCNRTLSKPPIIQSCFYTEKPSCYDGIKNCHDGSCEFLVDCGGACKPCATCSDKIQNQGEEGIDCGGPCPWSCDVEKPSKPFGTLKYFLIILVIILSIIVLIKLIRIFKIKEEIKEKVE